MEITSEAVEVLRPIPEPEPRRHRHRRHGPWWRKPPEPPRTKEQIAYDEARRIARRRSNFFSHAVVFSMVILLLLFTAGFYPATVVALAWGIGLASHGYGAIIAPQLQRRWIEQEYQLRIGPPQETARKQIEGRHAKSIENLSASIAHEIRNPITAAKSLVQQMGEDPKATENVEYAKVALEELDRVERSIAHLLRYAREEEVQPELMVLTDVVASALETFKDRTEKMRVDIEEAVDEQTEMQGDPEKLRRVVINLVGNALDALAASGRPDKRLTLTGGQNLAGTEVWLKVKDNGEGIEPDRLAKIFSPFHTSKEGGTGLGLAITKKLVEAHGGTIDVVSDVESGTEFELVFPRAPTETA